MKKLSILSLSMLSILFAAENGFMPKGDVVSPYNQSQSGRFQDDSGALIPEKLAYTKKNRLVYEC